MRKFFPMILLLIFPVFSHSVLVEYDWKGNSSRYHIVIGTNSTFYYPVIDDYVNGTNYLMELEAGDYFVKIASIYREIEGSFSRIISFTVITNADDPKSRITNIRPLESGLLENHSTGSKTRWNWIIRTNSVVNLYSIVHYAIDDLSGFKTISNLDSTLDLSDLSEGTHTLYYRLENPLKLEGKLESKTLVIDRTPPELEINASRQVEIGSKTFLYPGSKISATVRDRFSPAEYSFWINGKPVDGPDYSVDKSTNSLKATLIGWDIYGNETNTQREYYVDTTPPVITAFLDDKQLQLTNTTSIRGHLNFQVRDEFRFVNTQTILDDKTNAYIPPVDYKFLGMSPGRHSLSIGATDGFGNHSGIDFIIEIPERPEAEIKVIFISQDSSAKKLEVSNP